MIGAGKLHLLPKLFGRGFGDMMCRAPMLDWIVTYFTVLPLVAGPVVASVWLGGAWWQGLLGAVLGQMLTVWVWGFLHELAHPDARKGPRIVKALNRVVGRWRNHLAVWWTAWAVPVFWVVRLAEYFVYPPLIWLVRFPRYPAGEWVNVSRQKFEGLVGHDLIWCLYCDWMTGVWSLGTEMLRNVESFWCPIRFRSDKKCANCVIDFPDIDGGWTASDATIADAARVVEEKYAGRKENAWFGHASRKVDLTVEGKSRGA